ncbi:MAG: cytochrome b/b6 domain-containing protein [Burkholderiaceae bacterium]|nr:cytochrome b/b6 domain-containing protein [Burkholderiaceae bacterium]
MRTTNDRGVLVWDAPVRVFHWLLVASFAGAWLTAESERWRLVHVTLGYTMAALVVFRVVWGFVGTRHARFADFVRGPVRAWQYVRALVQGRPQHHAGHNPAGALAIVALLGLIAVTALSGFATYNELGGEWLEELHEASANTLLAVAGVHVIGVLVGSFAHRENLVRAMVTGRKHVPPSEGIRRAWRSVAALMLVATVGFWTWQWRSAPADVDAQSAAAASRAHRGEHHDRD